MSRKQALSTYLEEVNRDIDTMTREQLLDTQQILLRLKSTYEIETDEMDIAIKIKRAFDSGKITEAMLDKIMGERLEIIQDLGIDPLGEF